MKADHAPPTLHAHARSRTDEMLNGIFLVKEIRDVGFLLNVKSLFANCIFSVVLADSIKNTVPITAINVCGKLA